MAAKIWTYDEILRDIAKRQFYPVYLLYGEESYFVEQISKRIQSELLTPEEKDFNQIVLHGRDIDVQRLTAECNRFPLMAERQLVVVRQALTVPNLDQLVHYLKNIQPTTVLLLDAQGANKVDARKDWVRKIASMGVVFNANKLYESKIPQFITSYVSSRGYTLEPKAAMMMVDLLGQDLQKVVGEVDKIIIYLGERQKRITPQEVVNCIGGSKDYNSYELLNALAVRDTLKCFRIARHFGANSKSYPLVVTISMLFNYFSNLMICHFMPQRNDELIMQHLGLRSTYASKNYIIGLRSYNANKTMAIIGLLRQYDGKSKGLDSGNATEGELLVELINKIFH